MTDSGRYALTKDNKGAVDNALDFPRLKLEKKGEVARIAIIGIDRSGEKPEFAVPKMEGGFFFDLRVPGSQQDYKGSYECLAPEEVKREDGLAPEACPHCKAVASGVSEDIVGPRRRRFVVPVVRYRTKPGSADLLEPKAVEVLSWRFTDRYFNELVDANEKWSATGGLLGHDITLVCEVPTYQNFRFQVEPDAAWRGDADFGKLVVNTLLGALSLVPQGLRRQCGTTLTADQLDAKIKQVLSEAGQYTATAEALPDADAAVIGSLAEDLFSAPGSPGAVAAEESVTEPAAAEEEPAAAADPPAGGLDFDSFFGR